MNRMILSLILTLTAPTAFACKMTTLGASSIKIKAVVDHISGNLDNQGNPEITRISTDGFMSDMVTAEITTRADNKCSGSMYKVEIANDCTAKVSLVPTFAPILCK